MGRRLWPEQRPQRGLQLDARPLRRPPPIERSMGPASPTPGERVRRGGLVQLLCGAARLRRSVGKSSLTGRLQPHMGTWPPRDVSCWTCAPDAFPRMLDHERPAAAVPLLRIPLFRKYTNHLDRT
ncbi:hypothetical protein MRX96_030937 [Rhipicephalus microplus]